VSAPRPPKIACVLLAAGGSTRLGRPKQLVRRRGVPLVVRAAEAAVPVVDGPVVAVLGAEALRLRGVLRRRAAPVRVVVNARWADGLAGSLAAGLAALPADTRAVLILLADQPEVGPEALARLIDAWRRHPARAAASLYGGRAGVPAILPHRLFRAARTLDGDRGARALLRSLPDVTLVPMPEAALDIDTPDDLRRLR